MLGDHLLSAVHFKHNDTYAWCNKNNSALWSEFCSSQNNQSSACDEYDSYFMDNDLRVLPGIPGFASGVISGTIPYQFFDRCDKTFESVKMKCFQTTLARILCRKKKLCLVSSVKKIEKLYKIYRQLFSYYWQFISRQSPEL